MAQKREPDLEAARVDVALMRQVAARDSAALGTLYDRHHRLLFGLILRILRQQGEAEEVLQDVFVAVWTRADTYDEALGPPIAWMLRIARNRAVDRLRANAVRIRTHETAPAGTEIVETPEAHAWVSEQQSAVGRALAALPHEQRLLIEQAYFMGLTQSELAERHGLPLGTVKTRVRSGMMALRQALSHLGTES
jgi:RNA polymerase sigma-70 factor (ECF subfamily)